MNGYAEAVPLTESAPGEFLTLAQLAPTLESLDTSGPTARIPAHLYPPSVIQSAPAPPAPLQDPPSRAIPRSPAPDSLSAAWHKRKLSRRNVMAGLIGTAIVVGGGTTAFVLLHASQEPSSAQSTNPTPTPTPLPLGTTILTYRLHTDAVKAVAWSPPNGKLIASGSLDNKVRVWDASTGKDVLAPYTGHSKGVKTVAWSPNGTRLASGSGGNHIDNTVRVWQAK